jgi:hypothetical protein
MQLSNRNIAVRCTFNLFGKLYLQILWCAAPFGAKNKAAELQNICRNVFEK